MPSFDLPASAPGIHMLMHVMMMSLLAPMGAGIARSMLHIEWTTRPVHVWITTLLQLAVFLYWHSPAGMMLAMHETVGQAAMQISLLAIASLFWWSIAGLDHSRIWHGIAALLCTGKLFCLVAVLLTFAPRSLYHAMPVAEQQLAGLIMITLCPLTYVASALWLCRRWLTGIDTHTPAPEESAPC